MLVMGFYSPQFTPETPQEHGVWQDIYPPARGSSSQPSFFTQPIQSVNDTVSMQPGPDLSNNPFPTQFKNYSQSAVASHGHGSMLDSPVHEVHDFANTESFMTTSLQGCRTADRSGSANSETALNHQLHLKGMVHCKGQMVSPA
jgi:hypothetical protein